MILESLKDSDSFTYKVMNYDDFDQMITVQNLKFNKSPNCYSLGFLFIEI